MEAPPSTRLAIAALAVVLLSVPWAATVQGSQTTVFGPVADAKIVADDAAWAAHMGGSVAIDGDTLVAGEDWDFSQGEDPVRIFVEEADGWRKQATVIGADTRDWDRFGASVDVDGSRVAVGAFRASGSSSSSGAVYVFERSDGAWVETAKVFPEGHATSDLGTAVQLQGDRLFAAGSSAVVDGVNTGAVYVFDHGPEGWTHQATLAPEDGIGGQEFGWSLDADGDRVAVGAPHHPVHGEDSGAAYVFERVDGTWTQVAQLVASDGDAGDHLGEDVALDGDLLLAGAPGEEYQTSVQNGDEVDQAYVFTRGDDGWGEAAVVEPQDAYASKRFGQAVDLEGGTLAVGVKGEGLHHGWVDVFAWTEQGPVFQQRLMGDVPDHFEWFGRDLELDAGTLAVGAPGDGPRPVGGNDGEGAVYVFKDLALPG